MPLPAICHSDRMMRAAILALAALTALPALAADPLTAEEFEAYATGKTLTYAVGGQIYGTEEYRPGRRVLWAFEGEECSRGYWYPDAGQICFVYEDNPNPQCWTFYHETGGLRARFAGDPEGAELAAIAESREPLVCPGPDVGV